MSCRLAQLVTGVVDVVNDNINVALCSGHEVAKMHGNTDRGAVRQARQGLCVAGGAK